MPKNKDQKKKRYNDNAELLIAKSLYRYYKKKESLHNFEEKHPDKVSILKAKGLY